MRTGNMGKLLSLDARGKFGYSGAFGRLAFGYNRFGFYSWWCGIYQKKYYFGKPYISRMKFYRPTNPRTLKQQNWRMVASYMWVLWASFDDETKEQWKIRGNQNGYTGANAFMSQWLKNPTGGFGKILFSWNAFGFF